MATETFPVPAKASISLGMQAGARRVPRAAARAAGVTSAESTRGDALPLTAAIVETADEDAATALAGRVGDGGAEVERLSDRFLSVRAEPDVLLALADRGDVRRVQTKKLAQPHLDAVLPDVGLPARPDRPRPVEEDGTGVLVGIVDSGFDLSHPVFRDAAGRLRVEALLDQTLPVPREFGTAELETAWAGGTGPGSDENGHGTHVASIAAGSRFRGREGVAPGARFLLVKTNFRDTDTAVSWVFTTAGARPCAVNLSLGHHFGAHDGTDAEERLHARLAGPGRVVVVSAGNERADDIHLGGRFAGGETEEVPFDLLRQSDGTAFVVLTLWHPRADRFRIALVAPSGEVFTEPPRGQAVRRTSGPVQIEMAQQPHPLGDAVQHQVALDVPASAGAAALRGWRVRITCTAATVGRIDGWFHNSGFAVFGAHPLREQARTVGLAATGSGCLAVASHVTRTAWRSDAGELRDTRLVVGRSSPFSSLGPTRDGRPKPDVSAPGQMITAALAAGSESAADDRFAATADGVLTIAGTSMAAPVVTGAVAMLLQQKPDRGLADVRDLLARTVRRDAHTGPGPWDPVYGLGKLDVAAALRGP